MPKTFTQLKIKITTALNPLLNEVVSSRTMNSFNKRFYKHWAENPTLQTIQGCKNSRRLALWWKSISTFEGKGESSMARSLRGWIYYTTVRGVNYQLLVVMLLKQPNGQLPLTVDHSQLRTMVSETEDPIDWPLSPPFTGQCFLSATCTFCCALQINSVVRGFDPWTFGILCHRIAYAATLGIILSPSQIYIHMQYILRDLHLCPCYFLSCSVLFDCFIYFLVSFHSVVLVLKCWQSTSAPVKYFYVSTELNFLFLRCKNNDALETEAGNLIILILPLLCEPFFLVIYLNRLVWLDSLEI